jgi:flavin reductase (DIM6/NTAB) family NADH-FMN oxidoreductase RutF
VIKLPEKISKLLYPRFIVLITTCDRNGRPNVAPFSFMMPVSFNPKYLALSIAPERHTYKNLEETGEFVVNLPTEEMVNDIWICGTKSGKDVDKFSLTKLKTVGSVKVKPPRIEGCPVQLECKVEFVEKFGDHYLVVGRVLEEHVERKEFKSILHYTTNEFYKVGEKITL